jgi:bifunctional DNA-binding transcriptional regulator/antitoxin component of YhaV-PrlF toxin-antitoxin module
MGTVSVDQQGRLVLPRAVRRRFGLDGRPGRLQLVETADGVFLEAPPANATIVQESDGLPSVTIEGLPDRVRTADLIEAIEAERTTR